jgi:putative aldouronate transport system substrate-binding protein
MKERLVFILVFLFIGFALFATGTKVVAPEEVFELRVLMPGDEVPAHQEVWAYLNEKSAKEIGITYKTEFVSWGDFGTRRSLYLQSKEALDGMLIFQPELSSYWKQKAFAALNDYVNKRETPNLLKVIPLQVFEDMAIEGEYTNFPSVNEYFNFYHGWTIRKDLREKWGMKPVETLQDLEAYFEKAKQEGMIPTRHDHSHFNCLLRIMEEYAWFVGPNHIEGGPAYLDPKTNKISNWIEHPLFRQGAEIMRRWYLNGWQDPDIGSPTPTGDMFVQGRLASYPHQTVNAEQTNINQLKDSEMVAEAAVPNPGWKEYRDFWANNLVCVPRASENPGGLAKWLDWLYADRKDRYAIIIHGIPGTDFDFVDNDTIKTVSKREGDPYWPHWWYWQASLQFFDVNWPQELRDRWARIWDQDVDVLEDPTLAFFMDLSPIQTIATQIKEAYTNIGDPIMDGLVDLDDPEKGIPALIKAYKQAGVDEFLAEAQRQWDAFLAKK